MLADSSTPPTGTPRHLPSQRFVTVIGDRIEVIVITGTNTKRLSVAVPMTPLNTAVSSPATWGRLLATGQTSPGDHPNAHRSELVSVPIGMVMTRHCSQCGLHLDDAIDLRPESEAAMETHRAQQRVVAMLEPLERAGETWKREHSTTCRPFSEVLTEEERELLHGAMRVANRATAGAGLCNLTISAASGTSFIVPLPRLDVRFGDGDSYLDSPTFLSEGEDLTAALTQICFAVMGELARRAEVPESIVFMGEMSAPDHSGRRAVVALITPTRAVEAMLSADRSRLDVSPSVGLVRPFAGALGVWHTTSMPPAPLTHSGMLS